LILLKKKFGISVFPDIEDIEKALLLQALEKSGGSKTEAAKILGISFRSMRYRMERLGLK
jgi:two-component system response regulator PilR (NtrC family)